MNLSDREQKILRCVSTGVGLANAAAVSATLNIPEEVASATMRNLTTLRLLKAVGHNGFYQLTPEGRSHLDSESS